MRAVTALVLGVSGEVLSENQIDWQPCSKAWKLFAIIYSYCYIQWREHKHWKHPLLSKNRKSIKKHLPFASQYPFHLRTLTLTHKTMKAEISFTKTTLSNYTTPKGILFSKKFRPLLCSCITQLARKQIESEFLSWNVETYIPTMPFEHNVLVLFMGFSGKW